MQIKSDSQSFWFSKG